jgi:plasmid stabilization system protein ParE
MDTTTDNDDEFKPAKYTLDCAQMLDEALQYLRDRSPKQAEIMGNKFFKIVGMLERMPELGTICQDGMRKFKLGKFRYNIFYRVKEKEIEIIGIWHTSRGTDFSED